MNYCEWLHLVESQKGEGWEPELSDLSALVGSGLPCPPAFVVSWQAYEEFFAAGRLKKELAKLTKGLKADEPKLIAGVSKKMREAVAKTEFPQIVSESMALYFDELKTSVLHPKEKSIRIVVRGMGNDRVAVSRSIKTVKELEKLIAQSYAVLMADTDVFSRLNRGENALPEAYSVLISYQPESDVSGEAVGHDSINHDDTTVHIRAVHFGGVTHGEWNSEDEFRVDKKSLAILSRATNRQWWAERGDGRFFFPKQAGKEQTLTDEQAVQVARLVRRADAHFSTLKTYSWSIGGGQAWITGVRPFEPAAQNAPQGVEPTLRGLSAGLGSCVGPVRFIRSVADRKRLEDGDIAVVDHLTAKDATWLKKAAGVITESGTLTSPETMLVRKLLLPAVVGTGKAFAVLTEGQVVTVNGTAGCVFVGAHSSDVSPTQVSTLPVTGTKIWTIVADPYQIDEAAILASDGVGLLRGEFIIRMLGAHPQDILRKHLATEYSDVLAEGIARVARSANRHPVIYQLHDISSMDTIGLREPAHTRHEPNPTLGFRGTHRLLSEPELLELEIAALVKVAKMGLENVQVMLPMVRTIKETEKMLEYFKKSALAKATETKLWIKCETPGLLIRMDDLCKLNIGGVCFDVPSLTQFIQGIDKENRQVAHHLDTTDSAVEQALEYAIQVCRYDGMPSMLVAEMEELRPEVIQTAIRAGITGISVAPEAVGESHRLVASIEQRLLLDHLVTEHDEQTSAA